MKCRCVVATLAALTATLAWCSPLDPTTSPRSSQLPEASTTPDEPPRRMRPQLPFRIASQRPKLPRSPEFLATPVLDVRTPPKRKQQQGEFKKKSEEKVVEVENSHPGVAIPVDEESIHMDKMNFYKLDRPTTSSGISTWILLSGHVSSSTPSTTTTTSGTTTTTTTTKKGSYSVVIDRVSTPVFKRKGSSTTTTTTTEKPGKGNSTISAGVPVKINGTKKDHHHTNGTTQRPLKVSTATTKLTKVKASELSTRKPSTTTSTTTTTTTTTTTNTTQDSVALPIEAKDAEVDLAQNKKKKPKRKKNNNKNRRRKPAQTDLQSGNPQEKIGTQLYNYIAREVIPTVGAGLVGLMVTAGLATYFLYPFGAARRADDVDRKGVAGYHQHQQAVTEDYGMLEEDAIGKVIAGMPGTTRHGAGTEEYIRGSVESVPLGGAVDDGYHRRRFVVSEEATPAAVPEHGPRGIMENIGPIYRPGGGSKRRRKRSDGVTNKGQREDRSGISNELDGDGSTTTTTTTTVTTPVELTTTTTPAENSTNCTTRPEVVPSPVASLFDIFNDLIRFKVRLTVQLLQNATRSFSDYMAKAHSGNSRPKRSTRIDRSGISNEIDVGEVESTTPTPETSPSPSSTTPPTPPPSFFESFVEVLYWKTKQSLRWLQDTTVKFSEYISRVQSKLDENYKREKFV